MTKPQPNVFILGAPKCGTTNLVRALEKHSQVFLPYPKETGFWANDMYHGNDVSSVDTLDEYLELFAKAGPEKTHFIDGSVVYLYSKVAIARILEFRPKAKFIIMLRNPVEQVQSWHQEQVFNMNEDQFDFWTAWQLQEARGRSENVPSTCEDASRILYTKHSSLGDQLERAMALIPEGQLFVGFIDDIRVDARHFYRRVSDFLGLPDEDLEDIGVTKASHQHRFRTLARLYQAPPRRLAPFVRLIKKQIRTGNKVLLNMIKGTLTKDLKRPKLTPDQLAELHGVFDPQTQKLEQLTGRDLSDWRMEATG
ncbi:MAG: sulfotransferase [Marinovum sp.]|nr:sulfotransferase [Marinovum sp.]